MNYEKQLEALQKTFDKKVFAFANQVRRELIIPVCKKHGLKFFSGNGTFFFDKDGQVMAPDWITSNEELSAKLNLGPIFKVLDMEVSHNQHLGFWVSDYIPPALKRKTKPIA